MSCSLRSLEPVLDRARLVQHLGIGGGRVEQRLLDVLDPGLGLFEGAGGAGHGALQAGDLALEGQRGLAVGGRQRGVAQGLGLEGLRLGRAA